MKTHRIQLGQSVQGRPIEGTFFWNEVLDGPILSPLNTLLVGAFHGDEEISTALLERFSKAAAQEHSTLPAFLVIPAFNADGLPADTRTNANGVDLNRNYPTDNWSLDGEGTPYFSGPGPASEPETRLMIEVLQQYRPQKIITLHSPYKVINYDGPADALAHAMAAHCGYPVVTDIGYPTPGSFGNYAGHQLQIPVITLELPPNPDEPAGESLDAIWPAIYPALIAGITFK